MRKIDINNETVFKIVKSSIELFNINGYAGTSISDISKNAKLSKGILYHYFQNKDELYLYCAKMCIEKYMIYLEENLQNNLSQSDAITENVKLRIQFFDEYPQYRTFFNFIISKRPNHLAKELIELRNSLNSSSAKRLKIITGGMQLGKGITEQDIVAFIALLQNSSASLLYNDIDQDKKLERIETGVRLAKIFINGLKTDID